MFKIPATLEIEKISGKRAKFVVLYARRIRKKWKVYFDGLFSKNADSAQKFVEDSAKEMRWKIKILLVAPRDQFESEVNKNRKAISAQIAALRAA